MKKTRSQSTDILVVIQLITAAAAAVLIFLGFFDSSCSADCNYQYADIALWTMLGVSLGGPIATAIVLRTSWGRIRSNVIVSVGLGVIVLTYLIGRGLESAAYDLPFRVI